jgi:hypothetical protein
MPGLDGQAKTAWPLGEAPCGLNLDVPRWAGCSTRPAQMNKRQARLSSGDPAQKQAGVVDDSGGEAPESKGGLIFPR